MSSIQNKCWAVGRKQGSYLQDSDVAFLSTEMEAGLPRVVCLIGICPQTDQVCYHQVVVVLCCMKESSLQAKVFNVNYDFV